MDKPSMFEQARSFLAGAKIIIASDGIEEGGVVKKPTSPVILCAAFSIEVSLKLLHLQEVGQQAKGHELYNIFMSLPEDLRNILVAKYLSMNPGGTEQQVIGQLKDQSKIFVDWRYAFENGSTKECSPTFLVDFAIAISDYVLNTYDFQRNENGWIILNSS